jgi:hypothetical protein
MSDRTPVDTPLVSFDQQQLSPTVTTPTKQQKTNDFLMVRIRMNIIMEQMVVTTKNLINSR